MQIETRVSLSLARSLFHTPHIVHISEHETKDSLAETHAPTSLSDKLKDGLQKYGAIALVT